MTGHTRGTGTGDRRQQSKGQSAPLRLRSFFTFGYQAHTLTSMVQVLSTNDIELLVDVRQNPVSRKPGFSKRRLAAYLPRVGIEYLHYAPLGTPTHIRKIYYERGDVTLALKQYERYLESREEHLRSLVESVSSRRFCLLCLESDHNSCHRGVIADKLAEMTKCQPVHLV